MEKIVKTLRDSKTARWGALAVVAFTMLTGYMFQEIISPLKPMLESEYGWTSSDFGVVTSAYGWLNVFLFMLIIVGIILDKVGVRISALSAAIIMMIGAAIKYYSLKYIASDAHMQIFGMDFKSQIIIAGLGFSIFGVGIEYAGITVSKIIVKWFKGKEMALAMGLEMATARLGSFAALAFAPMVAKSMSITAPIAIGVLLLVIGFISFIFYFVIDVKLDKQDAENNNKEEEEPFKIKDILVIIGNRGFWYIAILCVLFYSAVFPFYKYGPDLMVNKYGIGSDFSGLIPSLLPFGTILLTPFFGNLYDRKGKGASIMLLGAALLIFVHFILWIPILNNVVVAIIAVIVLGIAFSLVPSAMWPSVPKIIPEKQLGTAYALIFWVQNWGLMGVPYILGKTLDFTNPKIVEQIQNFRTTFEAQGLSNSQIAEKIDAMKLSGEIPPLDYSNTWLIFVGLTLLSLLFAFLLKKEDKRKGYGLELPNIQK